MKTNPNSPSRKRMALVAHDKRKEKMAGWALKHRKRLIEHELYATAHTADIIAEVLNAPVWTRITAMRTKRSISQKLAFIGVWAFWKPSRFRGS
jgi:hypothetical protein